MATYGTIGVGAIDPFKPQPIAPNATPTPVPTAPPIAIAPAPPSPVSSAGTPIPGGEMKSGGSVYDIYKTPPPPNNPLPPNPTLTDYSVAYGPPKTPGGTSQGGEPTDIDVARQKQAQDQADHQAAATAASNSILALQYGSTPLTSSEQAQVAGLAAQFQRMIDQQNVINQSATGLANIRGYQTGAAEYDPTFQVKTIGAIASAGAAKVADLQIQEAAAIAKLTQSFHDGDIAAVKDAWNITQKAYEERQAAFKETIDDTQKAIKEANDAKVAAEKVYYDQVTKPIQDLQQIAKNMGAPATVMAKVSAAKTLDEAYEAAGNYAAQGTGMIAEYNYAKANGYTGTFSQYQNEDAGRKAAATAAANNAGMNMGLDETPAGLGADTAGKSILEATGLSYWAFKALTEGSAALSRFSQAQRVAIGNEIKNYAQKSGVDIATLQSQYKAYNEVLESNIERANRTRIMAGEIAGTADALMENMEKRDMYQIRAANLVDLMIGKEVNSPAAMKYQFQLKAMGNDLAGYFAAARGARTPELQDQREAASVIANGLNTGSVQAFKDSVITNEEKVNTVVNNAVDSTRKQVWELLGVGSKYKGGNSSPDQALQQSGDAKKKVDTYLKEHPAEADKIIKLYSTPMSVFDNGLPTDEQVAEYLHL